MLSLAIIAQLPMVRFAPPLKGGEGQGTGDFESHEDGRETKVAAHAREEKLQ